MDDEQDLEEMTKEQLIGQIMKLRKGLDVYGRERERFRHAHPEFTGDFFISGKLGPSDDNGLPDKIEVCPSYGCAWVQIYEKTNKTISFEGS